MDMSFGWRSKLNLMSENDECYHMNYLKTNHCCDNESLM